MKKLLAFALPLVLLTGCTGTANSLKAADDGQHYSTPRWFSSSQSSTQFARATQSNLARQAAEPADLTEPRKLGPANAQAQVGAVQRYQQGAVRGFGDVSLDVGGGQ